MLKEIVMNKMNEIKMEIETELKERLEKPLTITLVNELVEAPVYETQKCETKTQEKIQKPKDLPKTAIKMDEIVVCPFCFCATWRIGATRIDCYRCGAGFKKKLIISKNVYSINMNLKFSHDLYKAGAEE